MATIKSYTDISQSKTLSKILPLESADIVYICIDMGRKWINVPRFIEDVPDHADDYDIYAWSLAALLRLLPKSARLEKGNVTELCRVELPVELEASDWYVEPVDACYEMIIRLNDLNLL